MTNILIVEDDRVLLKHLGEALRAENYQVDLVADGLDAAAKLEAEKYDLVVLDWELPGKGGIEICRNYRERGGSTPVLILTGKTSLDEKVTGLDSGADDYLTKPFHPDELSARIKALLRRGDQQKGKAIEYKGVKLDLQRQSCSKGQELVHLRPKEFDVLKLLLQNPKEVFSSQSLLKRVWPEEREQTVMAVTTVICRLRKKLCDEKTGLVIETVHGEGYVLY